MGSNRLQDLLRDSQVKVLLTAGSIFTQSQDNHKLLFDKIQRGSANPEEIESFVRLDRTFVKLYVSCLQAQIRLQSLSNLELVDDPLHTAKLSCLTLDLGMSFNFHSTGTSKQ